MYQNFKNKCRGVELKDLFWKAGCTENKHDFENEMKLIVEEDPKVNPTYDITKVAKTNPEKYWAKRNFRANCLNDVVVNNVCESFNIYI